MTADPAGPTEPAGTSTEVRRTLLDHAPVACLIVESGSVVGANEEAVEVTRIPRRRLIGVRVTELVMADFETTVLNLVSGSASTTRTAPVRLARALAPVELAARPIGPDTFVVGVRSLEVEHRLSAQAGGELTHDPVTGFPDRHHLLSLLDQKIRATPRNPLALIGLWIDELPQLVSSRGELTVERVVREVGQRVQARLRSPDLLGRYDEAGFLGLLASDAPISQLTDIADRLRAEVAFPVELDGNLVSFTASVAVASITERRPTIEKIMAQLEAAAGRARAGGNRTDILEL